MKSRAAAFFAAVLGLAPSLSIAANEDNQPPVPATRESPTISHDHLNPELVGTKVQYGSRAGQTLTVVAASGIDSANSVIVVEKRRDDAASFCADYIGDPSETCISGELADPLSGTIWGNCDSGDFRVFYWGAFEFVGLRTQNDDDRFGAYVILDAETGVDVRTTPGGYDVLLGLFQDLCPSRLPPDLD
jgi:hypothetical protein